MKQVQDKITTCKRCSGAFCYEQALPDNVTSWLCMNCGFTTVSTMKVGSEQVKSLYNTLPDLYKDLLHEDDQSLVWAPATITVPEVGMVFIDGTNAKNYNWTFAPIIPIAKKDRKKYSKGQTHRVDMSSAQSFGPFEFINAMALLNSK